MSPSQDRIRVAISGGGIAGATLLHALLKHQHLDVHIFESAPAFKEAGMAIGVTRNAYQALELIGPSAIECLDNAGSIPHHGVRFMLAQGPDAGKMADEIDAKKDGKRLTSIVHRAALLKELLKDVPAEHMHASKKLASIDKASDESIILEFEDGSTHECDVLVGADGIHSEVRKQILGDADPASTPVSSDWVATLSLQPYDKMLPILGKEYTDLADVREWGWMGERTFMMHNVLSEGNLVQFIATIKMDVPNDEWMKVLEASEFKKAFSGWPERLQKALAEVLGDQETIKCISHKEHLPARTYSDGRMCVMGDAAHATTPWQASGGGMSMEDALILSSLLGRVKASKDVPATLKVYDEVRRPRTQRIVESSRGTGLVITGCNPDYQMSVESLKGRLPQRWDFILDFDNAKARDEALQLLEARM